ncbi:hypothetical protein DRW48_09740 [Paracoccus suum]|uniref:Sulphotransferase Stf0 domain-containing protein n=1 Tax=Paracoccus suum TaxID=2259340 RepID=A0A344PKN3_9RHOB|nr:Stf0 family sulfotransferase [Paracoccus suum]AXC49938.1 hypothetical protein DRW48_09740 [Paracoccus suum]
MSLPFIIWTMRRTGGTTLTNLLMAFSDRPKLEHEPFNFDRELGPIARNFSATKDVPTLKAQLREVLAAGPSIKHCYELASTDFNRILMQLTNKLGYRHIVLTRNDEAGRLLSLELAKITGVWGKHGATDRYQAVNDGKVQLPPLDVELLLGHQRACRRMTREVEANFTRLGISPIRIAFEDIYADPEAGRERVRALCAALEIVPDDAEDFETQLMIALREKGQNTAAIYAAVPNLAEAREAVAAAMARDG